MRNTVKRITHIVEEEAKELGIQLVRHNEAKSIMNEDSKLHSSHNVAFYHLGSKQTSNKQINEEEN